VLGEEFLRSVASKTVIDFGCGEGTEGVEIASFTRGCLANPAAILRTDA
jgi:16S rRNA G1207 methylase RsmC